jgi:hypothetical protein
MTIEQNITAILETYFCGFRSELIEACTKRIMEQIERQADTPQTERMKTHDYCDICNHNGCDNCIANNLDDYCVPSGYAPKDTPQTESTGSPIGDYRDGVGVWQTDCGWGEPNE